MPAKINKIAFAPDTHSIVTTNRSPAQLTVPLDQVNEIERLQRRVRLRSACINAILEVEAQHGNAIDGPLVDGISILEAVQELLDDINEAAAGIAQVLKAAAGRRPETAAKGDA